MMIRVPEVLSRYPLGGFLIGTEAPRNNGIGGAINLLVADGTRVFR